MTENCNSHILSRKSQFKLMIEFSPKTERHPKILYKYLDWSNVNHQKLFLESPSIFFSSPNFFNDPFDIWIPLRYDLLTKADLRAKYWILLKNSKYGFYPYNNKDISKIIDDILEKGPLSTDQGIEETSKKHRDIDRKFYGIFCMSANPRNKLMWSHYSNNHKGFVVGFNSKMLFESIRGIFLGPVIYLSEFKIPIIIPEIDPRDDMPLIKQLYFKSNDWKYEKEYRIIKIINAEKVESHNLDTLEVKLNDRNIIYDTLSVTKIIFGPKMPQTQKLDLYLRIQESEMFENVKFFEARLNKSFFKLDFHRIE